MDGFERLRRAWPGRNREVGADHGLIRSPAPGATDGTGSASPPPVERSRLVQIRPIPSVVELPMNFQGPAADASYLSQLEEFARNPAVLVELNSRCNFHCDYCRSPISDRRKGAMPRKLFNHILPQLKGLTERRLRVAIDGEPMLHPEFLEICLDANRAGHRLAVASNASAVRSEFLAIDMDLIVHVSTSAAEHARRSTASFERYLEKIRRYVGEWVQGSYVQNIELKVFFNAAESVDEELMLAKRRFVADFAGAFGIATGGCWEPPGWNPELRFRNPSGNLLRIRFQQTTEGGLYPNVSGLQYPQGLPPEWGFCDSPWKVLSIHSDGAVGFCCADITAKTVFTEPEEIWEKPLAWIWRRHPRLLEARRQFLAGRVELPICRDCLEICSNRESYAFTEIFPGDQRS